MKQFSSIFFFSAMFLAMACGSNPTPTPPPVTPTANQPGLSGISPPANSIWTAAEFTQSTTTCAQSGVQRIQGSSLQQWGTFCACVYSVVAVAEPLQTFQQNYDQDFQTLDQDGDIQTCAQKANLSTAGQSGSLREAEIDSVAQTI